MKRFMLALLLIIIPSVLLGGCGGITFLRQGEIHDGMPVVNNTHYELVVYRNSDSWTSALPPGGSATIPTTNWLGRYDTIAVYAKAYTSDGHFVGTADHGMIYLAPYDTYRTPWIVNDSDVRLADVRR